MIVIFVEFINQLIDYPINPASLIKYRSSHHIKALEWRSTGKVELGIRTGQPGVSKLVMWLGGISCCV